MGQYGDPNYPDGALRTTAPLESIDELEVLRTRTDASVVRMGEWFVP